MAKLISVTKSDKSGLKQLKKDSPQIFKDRISNFEKKYKNIIDKITINRNKIIAHVDISDKGSYFNMGFSEIEIDTKIESYKKLLEFQGGLDSDGSKVIEDLKKLRSKSTKDERYSPSDFSKEIDNLRALANEVLEIAHGINKYYYDKNQHA